MSITLGRNFLVSVGGNVVLGQKSGTISFTMDTIETTTKGTTISTDPLPKQYLANMYGWEITLNGAYNIGGTGGSDAYDIAAIMKAGHAVSVTCSVDGETYAGNGIVTSFSSSGDQGDLTTYDVTIQGTDTLTITAKS